MHGLNMYDYSARYYEPAIGRFTTVDPLAEKYYSWSPYVYVGDNPLKRIDPTGMEWLTEKDKKAAENMTNSLTKLRDNRNNDINKATAERDKIKNDPKMSQKEKDKKNSALDNKINNLTTERNALETSISDLNILTNSETLYTFNKVSEGTTPYLERSSAEDGVIIINHSGSLENKGHEAHHASQYDQGKVKFVANKTNEVVGVSLTLTQAEIGAYMIQYSINKGTMPPSKGGSLNSIFSITDKWLRGIYDSKGNFPYKNHY